MDGCRVNLGGMRSLLSDCRAESRYSDWSHHQINSRSDQLVCPQPRRSFNGRSQINFERSFTMHHEGDVDLDILAAIALDNESDDDLELGSDNDDSCFFCGSPPLRSDNPLSHDPEFRYLGDFYGTAKSCSTSVPKRSPQSFSPVAPARRIEGFSCGGRDNSGANRVLSALA